MITRLFSRKLLDRCLKTQTVVSIGVEVCQQIFQLNIKIVHWTSDNDCSSLPLDKNHANCWKVFLLSASSVVTLKIIANRPSELVSLISPYCVAFPGEVRRFIVTKSVITF